MNGRSDQKQMLPEQRRPLLQVLPAQQGWRRLPQRVLVPQRLVDEQERPTLQVLPVQQTSPEPPHDEQVLETHARPGLHALPEQQRWPLVPQATHDPPLQVSVALLQVLPPQQA